MMRGFEVSLNFNEMSYIVYNIWIVNVISIRLDSLLMSMVWVCNLLSKWGEDKIRVMKLY